MKAIPTYDFVYNDFLLSVISEESKTVSLVGYFSVRENLVIPTEVVSPYTGNRYKIIEIGDGAFKNSGLKSVKFPETLKNILTSAFENNDLSGELNLPNTIEYIGSWAFRDNNKITSVNLPENLLTLYGDSFSKCENLSSCNLSSKNKVYATIDGVVYDKNINVLILCPQNKNKINIPETVQIISGFAFTYNAMPTLTLPSSLRVIEYWAFYNSRLLEITIPDNVYYIGKSAFNNCFNLKQVTFMNSAFYLEYDCFYNTNIETFTIYGDIMPECYFYSFMELSPFYEENVGNAILYVPENMIQKYESTEPWSYFKEIQPIKEASVSISELENGIYRVYDLRGINILNTVDKSEINNLPHGLYIINGKKVKL